ncbi:glucose-1-phosphate thymidylyltransferase [Paenibacillus turicensis]|uniref:Glucose-1-phosphate thymidylyltransferase n=1 Tax=Paenibacillus turicensis TaxID=160487 RepID=A0ABS4FXC2_9BACL|nr:glucose-1-phosphate thymidylyltransferase RfbA [Paenibacillus turicensis]MBP1907223.1 glucose-1-phosphate thymidylyltransferase [Paenibacillus turicensis]
MKGIILAGGSGTRLHPLTKVTSKQLLPIYDKPMVYYPLSTLMLSGIRDILIISTPHDLPNFRELLGDGSQFGIKLSFREQQHPEGLAQAFLIAESFIKDDCCALILGDNIYYGSGLIKKLEEAVSNAYAGRATIFGYYVNDPERFGVMELDNEGVLVGLEEKPNTPKSNYCVTGLYFYDNRIIDYAKMIKPSLRGELEITDINRLYLQNESLDAQLLGRGFAWFDTGTMDSLMDAADFIRTVEKRQGVKISAPEEIAFRNGWISKENLVDSSLLYGKSPYGWYLKKVADGTFIY